MGLTPEIMTPDISLADPSELGKTGDDGPFGGFIAYLMTLDSDTNANIEYFFWGSAVLLTAVSAWANISTWWKEKEEDTEKKNKNVRDILRVDKDFQDTLKQLKILDEEEEAMMSEADKAKLSARKQRTRRNKGRRPTVMDEVDALDGNNI